MLLSEESNVNWDYSFAYDYLLPWETILFERRVGPLVHMYIKA